MRYRRHLVTNHPPNTPVWKKVLNNIIFSLAVTKIRRRHNLLTPEEFLEMRSIVKPGDLILVGALRRLSSVVIRGPVTHALICSTKKWYIHATVDGVERMPAQQLFEEYDTLAILRPKTVSHRSKKIKKTLRYIRKQIGKPFDFYFQPDKESFYCTQLICRGYTAGGILCGFEPAKAPAENLTDRIKAIQNAPHPKNFVNEHFEIVYTSSRLSLKNNKLVFVGNNPWL